MFIEDRGQAVKSGMVTLGATHYSTSMSKNILMGKIYQEWILEDSKPLAGKSPYVVTAYVQGDSEETRK